MREPAKALPYGLEALEIAEALKDSAAIAIAANDLAITEYRLGHVQRALDLNRRALRIRKVQDDPAGMAASHSKIASCFTELMTFDSSLVHNYAAERIFERLNDVQRRAQVRGNIAHLYQQMGDLDKAESILRETRTVLEKIGPGYPMAMTMGQFCQVLEQNGKLQEALTVGTEALALFEQLGMNVEVASINNQLGMIARKQGEDLQGLAYYRTALAKAKELGDLTGQATYGMNVANALSDLGRLDEAVDYYEQSLELCRREGYADQHISLLGGYVRALEKKGDLRMAMDRQRELQAVKDSVFNADRAAVIGEMQVKYETERTEKELALAREKEEAQQAELERRRIVQGALIGGLFLLALVALLFISRQRAVHAARLNAGLLAERENGLKAVLANTDAERKRIATELHDGVGQQLTGLKFRLEDMGPRVAASVPALAAHVDDVLAIAEDASREVRGIAHRMMPRALGQLGLAPAMDDMLRKALTVPGIRHHFEHFGLDERLPAEVEVGVFRIAQELVGNILKHADASEVNVQLMRTKGHLILMVEDNGKGFDTARNTNGMGLQNMNDRARVLHGTFSIERKTTGGTLATVRVPLITEQEIR